MTNTNSSTRTQTKNGNCETNIINMFPRIGNAVLGIRQQQIELNDKFDPINAKLNSQNENINQLRYGLYDAITHVLHCKKRIIINIKIVCNVLINEKSL